MIVRGVPAGAHVLDVGCGDGYLMSLAGKRAKLVVGIDSEFTAIEVANRLLKQQSTNCAVANGSSYQLPFASGIFDVVLMADVIEHLDTPPECLREVRRVLKPEGVLYVTTPKWRPDRKWDPRHFIEYKPEELLSLLHDQFSRVEMRYFWPMWWSNMYSTRIGWQLIKRFARYAYNPFLAEGTDVEKFGQMLAICRT